MATHKGRRDFLTKVIPRQAAKIVNEAKSLRKDAGQLLREVTDAVDEVRDEVAELKKSYFASFESCYPLLSECGSMLFEEAARLKIPVEGRSRLDIAREIWAHLDGPPATEEQSNPSRDKDSISNREDQD